MNPFKSLFGQRFLNKRVSPIGLSLFRILYSLIILWEVFDLFRFRHLMFDQVPFTKPGEIDPSAIFVFWFCAILALLVGWKTRTATLINFCCSLMTFASFNEFEYHFDHIAHSINFMLLFLPVSEMFSIDAWMKRKATATQGTVAQNAAIQTSNTRLEERGIHPIYYFVPMFVCIALLYLDSVCWKLTQTAWQTGWGVWRPTSLPPFTWFPTVALQGILNQKWLMITANYATLFLEIAFILLMWSRRCRVWILIPLGLALHAGIALAFPIPKFSFIMLALYALVVPPDVWERVYAYVSDRILRLKQKHLAVDSYSFDHATQKAAQFNNPKLIYGIVGYMAIIAIFQFLLMLGTPLLGGNLIVNNDVRRLMDKAFGVCSHGVFLDHHWDKYDHVVAVAEVRNDGSYEWLPYTTEKGQMGSYATDRMWTRWGLRANGPYIVNTQLEATIQRITAFWLGQNGRTPKDAKFVILAKAMHPNMEWRKNQLKAHMATPWQVVGEVNWNANKTFKSKIARIEQVTPLDVGAPQLNLAERVKTIR